MDRSKIRQFEKLSLSDLLLIKDLDNSSLNKKNLNLSEAGLFLCKRLEERP